MENKQGINPVTVRPLKTHPGLSVAMMRLHIGQDRLAEGRASPKSTTLLKRLQNMKKYLTVALTDEGAVERGASAKDVTYATTVDEDLFISALGHLFPKGELAEVHHEESDPVEAGHPPVGEELMKVIRQSARSYYHLLQFVKGLAVEKTESEIDEEDDVLENDTAVTFYSDVIQQARDVLNLIGEKPEGS